MAQRFLPAVPRFAPEHDARLSPGLAVRSRSLRSRVTVTTIPRMVALRHWWALTGSNRRHLPCKGSALPTELSARLSGAAPMPCTARRGKLLHSECLFWVESGH